MQVAAIETIVYMTQPATSEAFYLVKVNSIDHIIKRIQQIVRSRNRSVLPKKISTRDKEWFDSL